MPYTNELKVREWNLFRSYYCGLCKEITARYGQIARFALTYDCTFFALALASIHDEKVCCSAKRCPIHPIAKRPVKQSSPALASAAAANTILAYHKLADDKRDEGGAIPLLASAALNRAYNKARRDNPGFDKMVREKIAELSRLEQANCSNIDLAAEPFALMMACIASDLHDQTNDKSKAERFGYNVGKWLYLIDALDDIEKDMLSGSYNPFIAAGKPHETETFISFHNRMKQRAERLLMHTLAQIAHSYEELAISVNNGLFENVIYIGMRKTTEDIIERRRRTNNERPICSAWNQERRLAKGDQTGIS